MVPSSPRPPAVSLGFEYPLGSASYAPPGLGKKPRRGSPRRPPRSPPRRPTRPSGPSPETRASARPSRAGRGARPGPGAPAGRLLFFPDAPERARTRPSTSSLAAAALLRLATELVAREGSRDVSRSVQIDRRGHHVGLTPRERRPVRLADETRAPLQPTERHRRGLHLPKLLDDPPIPDAMATTVSCRRRMSRTASRMASANLARISADVRLPTRTTNEPRLRPPRRHRTSRPPRRRRPPPSRAEPPRTRPPRPRTTPPPARRRRGIAAAARSQRLPRANRALDVAAEDPIHQRGVPRRAGGLAAARPGDDGDDAWSGGARRWRRRRRPHARAVDAAVLCGAADRRSG